MNILLKYFIYFLLGIIIYYCLFNSPNVGAKKVIEGFDNANIASYFNTNNIHIFVSKLLTGIGKTVNTDTYEQVSGVTLPSQTSTSLSFSYDQIIFDATSVDIGYSFRPDIYMNPDAFTSASSNFEGYSGVTNARVDNFKRLKLNPNFFAPPQTIKVIFRDDAETDQSLNVGSDVKQLTIVSFDTSTYTGDQGNWLMRNWNLENSTTDNLILYRETNGNENSLEILIKFPSTTDTAQVIPDLNSSDVNVYLRNIMDSLEVSTLVNFITQDQEDALNSLEIAQAVALNSQGGLSPLDNSTYTRASINEGGGDDITVFSANTMHIKDFYNYIPDGVVFDNMTPVPLITRQTFISPNQLAAIQAQTWYSSMTSGDQQAVMNSIVKLNDGARIPTAFKINIYIYNDTPIPSINGQIDISHFVNTVTDFTYITNSSITMPGTSNPEFYQVNDENKDVLLNLGTASTDTTIDLFQIIKLYQDSSPDRVDPLTSTDTMGNLELALLLSMRSIGTTRSGTIPSPLGCAAAGGADGICSAFNEMEKYRYAHYTAKLNPEGDQKYQNCNPRTPGSPSEWQFDTGFTNCHVDPTACCVTTQCSKLIRQNGNFCADQNKHINPYGSCAAIGVDPDGDTAGSWSTCGNDHNSCCGMPIHSAITKLFYTINNFNYNNGVTLSSRTNITRNNIRNFIYGELILMVNDDSSQQVWPESAKVMNKDTTKYTSLGTGSDIYTNNDDIRTEGQLLGTGGFELLKGIFDGLLGNNLEYILPDANQITALNVGDPGQGVTADTHVLILNNDVTIIDNLLDRIILTTEATTGYVPEEQAAVTGDQTPEQVKSEKTRMEEVALHNLIITTENRVTPTATNIQFDINFDAIYNQADDSNLASQVGIALNRRSGSDADLDQIKRKYKQFMNSWGKSIPYNKRTIENEIKLSLLLLDHIPPANITGTTGLTPLQMAFSEESYNTSTFAMLM